MIKRSLFYYALLAALSQLSFGQIRLYGLVTDTKTNEPLAFAHVQLMNSSLGTVTNNQGQFSIVLSEDQLSGTLGFSYLGYENTLVPISTIDLARDIQIRMVAKAIQMNDLIVSSKQKSLIEEAVAAIPKNHDQGEMKLRGFWRATIKGSSDYLQVSESIFDIYRTGSVNYLEMLKGRMARDSAGMKRLSNFNAGIRPNRLFDDSFLVEHFMLSKKTRQEHEYELTDIQTYDGRPVYVIQFDRKEKSRMNGYKGTIWLDVETLAFVKIRATYSPKNGTQMLFENSRLIGVLAGLSKSTMDSYFVEISYRHSNGLWYLTHSKYDVRWTMVRDKKNIKEPIHYTGDFVITDFSKKFTLPEDLTFSKNKLLEQQENFNDSNFWKDFTFLEPNEDLEKIFMEIDRRNQRK